MVVQISMTAVGKARGSCTQDVFWKNPQDFPIVWIWLCEEEGLMNDSCGICTGSRKGNLGLWSGRRKGTSRTSLGVEAGKIYFGHVKFLEISLTVLYTYMMDLGHVHPLFCPSHSLWLPPFFPASPPPPSSDILNLKMQDRHWKQHHQPGSRWDINDLKRILVRMNALTGRRIAGNQLCLPSSVSDSSVLMQLRIQSILRL